MELHLRPVMAEDDERLYEIFATSRPELMMINGLDDDAKSNLIKLQYYQECEYIKKEYPFAEKNIVIYQEEVAGRYYINRTITDIRIIEISILPQYRNQGIGTYLLHTTIEESRETQKSISLNVMWHNNMARVLYERLGFVVCEDRGVSCEMKYRSA